MKKDTSPSLVDYLVERRKIKQEFFTQINTHIDWRVISNTIKKYYIIDSEARWIKKGGKTRYGYKKQYLTDTQGVVLGVVTTPANLNEISIGISRSS